MEKVVPEARKESTVPEARKESTVPEARKESTVPEARENSTVPEAREESTVEIRIARVFADADVFPGDPRASWLTDPGERERTCGYLGAGVPILMTTTLLADRLDPACGRAVGASYRTDGSWIWSDALAYYVGKHGLAPEDEFRDHIAGRGYACPVPDEAARDRALTALYAWFAREGR